LWERLGLRCWGKTLEIREKEERELVGGEK
jgi:hypothetical protein